jgi:hypothetical protein
MKTKDPSVASLQAFAYQHPLTRARALAPGNILAGGPEPSGVAIALTVNK